MISRKHIIWPGLLIAMIGSLVVLDVTMIFVASSDKAIRIERTANESAPLVQRTGRMSVERWRIAVQLGAADMESVPVIIKLADLDGTAVEDANVDVEATFIEAPDEFIVVTAVLKSPGTFVARLPVQQGGKWKLDVHVHDDRGEQFMSLHRIIRPATKPAPWP